MASLNICGFELADEPNGIGSEVGLSGTSLATFGEVQASIVRSGSRALKCDNTAGASTDISFASAPSCYSSDGTPNGISIETLTTVFYRFYFCYTLLPATGEEWIFKTDQGNGGGGVRIDSTGALSFWISNATFNSFIQLGSSSTPLASGEWYRIEIETHRASGSQWQLRIDGETTASGLSVGSLQIISPVFGKRDDLNGNFITFYYDDFASDDSDFPGEGSVISLPNSGEYSGSSASWTLGAGSSKVAAVSEIPADGDTTYITCSTNLALEGMESINPSSTGITGTINAVKVIGIGAKGGSTVTAGYISMRSSGTVVSTTAADWTQNTNGYDTRAIVRSTNPATNLAWSLTEVNDVQSLITHNQSQARPLRCTALYTLIDYVPPPIIEETPGSSPLGEFDPQLVPEFWFTEEAVVPARFHETLAKSATDSISVSANAGISRASGYAFAPTVTANASANVSHSTASGVAFNPSVTANASAEVTVSTASGYTFATNVVADSNVSVGLASASGITYTPTISLESPTSVNVNLSTASGIAFGPSVVADSSADGTLSTATTDIFNPGINADANTNGSLSLASGIVFSSSVTADANATGSLNTASVAIFTPTINTDSTVDGNSSTASGIVFSTSVTADSNITVNVSIASGTTNTPNVTADSYTGVSVSTASGVTYSPTISIDAIVDSTNSTATGIVHTPTVTANAIADVGLSTANAITYDAVVDLSSTTLVDATLSTASVEIFNVGINTDSNIEVGLSTANCITYTPEVITEISIDVEVDKSIATGETKNVSVNAGAVIDGGPFFASAIVYNVDVQADSNTDSSCSTASGNTFSPIISISCDASVDVSTADADTFDPTINHDSSILVGINRATGRTFFTRIDTGSEDDFVLLNESGKPTRTWKQIGPNLYLVEGKLMRRLNNSFFTIPLN